MPTYNRGHYGPEEEDFVGYADGDGAFAAWCEEVHKLAVHFCSGSFFEYEEVMDAPGEYQAGTSPTVFFRGCILPELVCDHGYDEIEHVIADHVFWGNQR
jgi:hypothetical protein